ncbi:hypothetical protein HYX02_04340 [Candidatus Woesearchaeota archaeon]|nr:hypothetical protein [Candidatus Woesearchaeota archaeon]
MVIGAESKSKNSKYDFKTIKVRPITYKRLVRLKALIEGEKQELYSFDELINHIIDSIEKDNK